MGEPQFAGVFGSVVARPVDRRLARLLVLLLAGLAVAGTSPSPPPPPLATAHAEGELHLTAERPIASVDVTIQANAVLRGLKGSVVTGQVASDPVGSAPAGPAIVTIVPLDDPASSVSLGSAPSVSVRLDAGCPPDDACARHYRITAVLVDPTAEDAVVSWHASAEFRSDGPERPSAAPADGRLEVAADDVTTRPAVELARASLAPETIHLDRDHPLASRDLEIDQPPGLAGAGAERTWLAFLTVTAPGAPAVAGDRPAIVQVGMPGREQPLASGSIGRHPIYPDRCAGTTGCPTPLRLDAILPGGPGDLAKDVTWSIDLVAYGPVGAAPPEPLAARLLGSTAIDPSAPRLTASETGAFDIAPRVPGRRNATVTLDATRLAQVDGPISGQLQLRFEVTTTSTGPVQTLDLALGAGSSAGGLGAAYESVPSGRVDDLDSAVVAVECDGRSSCQVDIPFSVATQVDATANVHVAWKLTALWYPDAPHRLPPDVALLLAIETASPRP
ncbi:MAG TPA: hypothetical protein VHM48_08500 [Candidatus Limnocylindrales bacterium]|nr:hypothetical protein [Candidatus Limnocylindrales bacterium]